MSARSQNAKRDQLILCISKTQPLVWKERAFRYSGLLTLLTRNKEWMYQPFRAPYRLQTPRLQLRDDHVQEKSCSEKSSWVWLQVWRGRDTQIGFRHRRWYRDLPSPRHLECIRLPRIMSLLFPPYLLGGFYDSIALNLLSAHSLLKIKRLDLYIAELFPGQCHHYRIDNLGQIR